MSANLECHDCGQIGYEVFGVPPTCPYCGSHQVGTRRRGAEAGSSTDLALLIEEARAWTGKWEAAWNQDGEPTHSWNEVHGLEDDAKEFVIALARADAPITVATLAALLDDCTDGDGQWNGGDVCDALFNLIQSKGGAS